MKPRNMTVFSYMIKIIYLAHYIYIGQTSSLSTVEVYIQLAESAKCSLFYQVRGIIQNACYCLFSTDLNKIFHIKDFYIYSIRENNSLIYKNDHVQKFTYA